MMPIQQRFRYASHAACIHFGGFAAGVFTSIGLEILIRPDSLTDTAKFGIGTLVAIYAIFTLLTGALAAFGSFFSGYAFPAVPISQWHWALAFGLGGINAAGMIGATYIYEADLLSPSGLSLLSLSGLLVALPLRPIGFAMRVARPWFAAGMCQACGYDLRETPADASCPECGTLAGSVSSGE